ncbi:MAG: acyltransferase, partial [Lachnospiraceae bacterium]|nr:acyltransferase [Lachnospiraceae bacterium]
MDYSLLSKYRGQLMGLAIIFVALFHSSLDHSYLIVDMLCFGGDMGVDIFFLISGFGMYYAFLKKPKLLQFYMKRVSRIVPAWFIVNLIIRFQEDDLTSIDKLFLLKTMTGFSFWIDGNLYFWYVSAILAFYLITPLFMFLYQKKKHYAYLTFSIIWFLLLGMSFVAHNASYFIFLFRWPVFFLGIYLGEC